MPSTTSWPGSTPTNPSSDDAGAAGPASPAEDPGRLGERLGYHFEDLGLLRQALSHRSWCGEQGQPESNERLEFLGDAVLGLVVAEHSYGAFPGLPEGQLAKIRSAVVNARILAEIANELSLGDHLMLGRGEEASGGRTKVSILADAMEAVIGAVYLDGGWGPARALVLRLLERRIAEVADAPDGFDHKSRLQELTVHRGAGQPRYVLQGSGPDHERRYPRRSWSGGSDTGWGKARRKRMPSKTRHARPTRPCRAVRSHTARGVEHRPSPSPQTAQMGGRGA